MPLAFVRAIIEQDWHGAANKTTSDQLSELARKIAELSKQELGLLVDLYFKCAQEELDDSGENVEIVRALIENSEYVKGTRYISRNLLANFLHALMLAEYRLDDLLLHPSQTRMAEFDLYASDSGFDRETLRRIYLNWQNRYRKEIYV